MFMDTLLDEIIKREGVKDTNNPNDSGGRTKFGISEKWHPEAWTNGPPTLEQAKTIYFDEYVVKPGFTKIQPEYLMAQLIDWGVNSGPTVAIQRFQKLLGVAQDGIIGPSTLQTLKLRNPETINNQLANERVLMLSRLVQKRPKDLEFLFGWVRRAQSFQRF